MKKKLLVLIILTAVLIGLASCGAVSDPAMPQAEPESAQGADVSQEPDFPAEIDTVGNGDSATGETLDEPDIVGHGQDGQGTSPIVHLFQLTDKITVHISGVPLDVPDNEFPYRFVEFNEFSEGEFYWRFVITPNIPLKDFRIVEVGYYIVSHEEMIWGDMYFYVRRELFIVDELLPERPLVLAYRQHGIAIERGFTFLDENNVQRFFYLLETSMGVGSDMNRKLRLSVILLDEGNLFDNQEWLEIYLM